VNHEFEGQDKLLISCVLQRHPDESLSRY
jgi:hypothetical protein